MELNTRYMTNGDIKRVIHALAIGTGYGLLHREAISSLRDVLIERTKTQAMIDKGIKERAI